MTEKKKGLKPSDLIFVGSPGGRGIDPWILPLVEALRRCGFDPLGSCCGHGRTSAYVDMAVFQARGVQKLAALADSVARRLDGKKAYLELSLIFHSDVVTACSPSLPEWVMFSLRVVGVGRGPTKKALHEVASVFDEERCKYEACK